MKKYIVLITMLVLVTLVLAAPTKVTIWYSQTGIYSQTLLDIVDEFNKLHEEKLLWNLSILVLTLIRLQNYSQQ